LDVEKKINAIVLHLHSLGYLTAGIEKLSVPAQTDSLAKNDTLVCELHIGSHFKRALIGTQNISSLALRKTGLKSSFPEIHKFSYKEFYRLEKKLIDFYQTIGFPFAYVYLDSISVEKERLQGELKLVTGPFIVFDSLHIVGKTKTKKKFLGNYTRIRKGDPFNQTTVDNAYKLVKQLQYLKIGEPPTVSFINGKAYVTFYMEDKKSNQVDGVIGFLPNQQTTGAQSKILITGEFNLNLKNISGRGKALSIEWKRLKPQSQLLNLEYYHPNLFGSPLNIIPSFNLQKQDSTFQNVISTLKTNFTLAGGGKMGFYVSSKQSRLISTSLYSTYSTPPFLDFNLNTYGIQYEWTSLDDYFYPKRGTWLSFDGNIGLKNIKKNARLPESLYDGVKENTTQFYLKGEARHFFRTGQRSTLLSSLRGGRVFNDNLLLTNDLFQIGGLKTLRGFNENFFFAEYYSTATLEFRQFTDENSYVLAFVEKSYMKYRLGTDSVDDWPLGVGIGVSLSTNTGIFNFVYSMGQAIVQRLEFSQSKISFGYVTRF
jgi:outer membrane protein assembly factor BamA